MSREKAGTVLHCAGERVFYSESPMPAAFYKYFYEMQISALSAHQK